MSVTIKLPYILSQRTGQQQISVEGSCLREIVDQIDKKYPGFKNDLLNDDNRVRQSFLISIDGNLIQDTVVLDKNFKNGSIIIIDRMISGG